MGNDVDEMRRERIIMEGRGQRRESTRERNVRFGRKEKKGS